MMNSGNPDILRSDGHEEPGALGEDHPSEQEGLRLIQAFRTIPDAKVRRTLLGLVENVARHMARRSRDP